ncbi:hypothetical protein B0H17DRAFT_1215247 [Mycena rosella]|uniref:Uncharacterized protein n=1 Tax=Mycena rosella TaxID=1033263 RepID=A0AAD7CL20_MYCRO|nr:hypothetical protein B0H17DRAFT_1215247 [Mycena rosella]
MALGQPIIVAWADALAQVDQSASPFTSDLTNKQYILPESTLLVNTTPNQCCKFLHWNLLSDGFIYMISQLGRTQLPSTQEWRDIPEGLTVQHSVPSSSIYMHSTGLKDHICLALQASNVSSIKGFPVPLDSLPEFGLK